MASAWRLGALAIALSMPATGVQAQTANAVRKTAEATMLVTGEIEISPKGRVQHYTLDHQDKLPPEAVQLLDRAIPQWTFEPVERQGSEVAARSKMTVRLVARKVDEGYALSVRGAQFNGDPKPGETVSGLGMAPPRYPVAAAQARASGTVYLLLEVGRDGKVVHADAAQTNLTTVADARTMDTLRSMFEQAALRAARTWTFNPPTTGEAADDASWVVRVPVDYRLNEQRPASYGQWDTYIPGPRSPIPWMHTQMADDGGLDIGAGGEVTQLGHGLTLQTPLGAG